MSGIKPIYRAAIAQLLGNGEFTLAEIAVKVPCSQASAYRNINKLRELGLVRVCRYDKSGDTLMAVMTLGSDPDALRPPPVITSIRMRKSRRKMSADDKDFLKARRRQKSRTIKIDPLMAAFFGGKK